MSLCAARSTVWPQLRSSRLRAAWATTFDGGRKPKRRSTWQRSEAVLGTGRRLRREELPLDTVDLARMLLGALLRSTEGGATTVGRIVETEAYLADDASSHAFRGPTRRNAAMFFERGHAYVYLIYGTSYCLNVTAETAGHGAAVLVRAVEPLEGIEVMRSRRPGIRDRDLTRGPGRVCAALAIGADLDGVDLCTSPRLGLYTDGAPAPQIGTSTRIGISKERERPHRFYVRGNAYVSGPRRLSPDA